MRLHADHEVTAAPVALPTPKPEGARTRRAIEPNPQATGSAVRHPGWRYTRQALLTSLPLVVADLAAVATAALLAKLATNGLEVGLGPSWWLLLAALSATSLLANTCAGLYPAIGLAPYLEARQTSLATSLVFAVMVAATVIHRTGTHRAHCLILLAIAWAVAIVFIPWGRSLARTLCARFTWWGHPTIIFGAGPEALAMYAAMRNQRNCGLRPIGIVDDPHRLWHGEHQTDAPYLGPLSEAAELADRHAAFWAVISLPNRPRNEVLRVLNEYAVTIPNLLVSDDTPSPPSLWSRAHECGGKVCIHIKQRLLLPLPRLVKRTMDLVLALCAMLVLTPLLLLIAVLIKLESPGPILYAHDRLGKGGRGLRAWKFRTMVVNAERVLSEFLLDHSELQAEWDRDHKLKRDPRVSRIGRILRRTSLDELPQIWNVLIGEMSLVGPRPIVSAEIVRYSETYHQYTRVKPGITGLWQVSGRNNTTYEERVAYDAYYVRNWSPWLDLYILFRTFRVVLLGEGAY